jgi:DNA ligase-associated metallophosphoesterase
MGQDVRIELGEGGSGEGGRGEGGEARGRAQDAGDAFFVLTAERAAYWPSRKTLIVADLHLGKANALAAGVGTLVPAAVLRGVLREDLTRLGRAIARHGAERVVVVGDLLHAPAGVTTELVEEVAAWRAANPQPWVVVPGNHDKKVARIASAWGLTVVGEEMSEGGVRFVHIPPTEARGEVVTICGHEHPAVSVGLARPGRLVKLPAFRVRSSRGAGRMILPAMSRFTAGVPVVPGPGERVFACGMGEVFEVPGHALMVR